MEQLPNQAEPRRVPSLFVSDVHLGSPFAKAEEFLSFVENCSALVELHDGRMRLVRFQPTTAKPGSRDPQTVIPAQDTTILGAADPPAASPVGPPLAAKEWQVSDTEDRPREVRISLR
jgi:hypothetical protein